jgi:hypothetical protein
MIDQYINTLDPYWDLLVSNEEPFEGDYPSETFFYEDIVPCIKCHIT